MKDGTWLAAFVHELEAAGVAAADRAAAVVETESFLADADVGAFEHFGSPQEYAAAVASALGGPGDRPRPTSESAEPVVVVAGVSKAHRRTEVLRDISFDVRRGDVVVLTGPNGAGKSTLLRIIAGIERPDTGSVTVSGAVGFLPQHGGLDPWLRPAEHFALFGAAAGMDRGEARHEGIRLARELGWDAAAAPIADQLSGGTRQKLGVVTALLGAPTTLLLDEPYQGMDADGQRRFWELLWTWQDGGGSAVVSSHSSDALARATTVVEIDGLPSR